MKRWIELVSALYPRSWREEFGAEFGALLDDVKPSWRVFRNVLGGAIEMQITTGTSWAKVAGVTAVFGAVVALGMSFGAATQYVSSAVVSVAPQPDPVRQTSPPVLRERAAERVALMEEEILSRTSLSSIINDPRLQLYKKELELKPIEDVIAEMRRSIRIEARPSAEGGLAPIVFSISFSYPDQEKAQATVRALSNKFIEDTRNNNKYNGDAYRGFWQDMSEAQHTKTAPPPPVGDIAELLSSATTATEGAGPNRAEYLAWGLGLGLLLGVLGRFAMQRPRGVRRLVGYAAAGFIVAASASYLIPNRFTSNAVMMISPAQVTEDPLAPLPPVTPAAEFLRQMEPAVLSFHNLSTIILNPRLNLYESERGKKPLEEVVRNMLAKDLRIAAVSPASAAKGAVSAFRITFSCSDRFKAQQAVQALMNSIDELYMTRLRENTSQSLIPHTIAQRKAGEVLDVLDTATLPGSPVAPNRLLISMLGLAVGLLLGVIRLRRRPVDPGWRPRFLKTLPQPVTGVV